MEVRPTDSTYLPKADQVAKSHIAPAPDGPVPGLETADVMEWSPDAAGLAQEPLASRIEELRRRIAAGDYITADKIEVVVDRLQEKLHRERLATEDQPEA